MIEQISLFVAVRIFGPHMPAPEVIDVVHSPLFQVTAGIFPDQAGDDVQREQLAS